jgi:hypothetical protein
MRRHDSIRGAGVSTFIFAVLFVVVDTGEVGAPPDP